MSISREHVQTQENSSEIEASGSASFSPPEFSLTANPLQAKMGDSAMQPIQREKDPKVEHEGRVGMEKDEIGPATGNVTARSGVKLNETYDNTYEIGYSGMDADKAHWLQFVKFEMQAGVPGNDEPVHNTGSVGTSSGNKPYSTPEKTDWTVDSANSSSPFYDVTFAGSRDPGVGVKIFDAAGGPSWSPEVNKFIKGDASGTNEVVFTATFHTYLVIGKDVKYRVSYNTKTRYTIASDKITKVGDWDHNDLGGGNAAGLPENLKKILDKEYAGTGIN
jgi:hypothetical protein